MKETPEQIYSRRKSEIEAFMAEELGRLRECPECHATYWALRTDQTTCGVKCRVRSWRAKQPTFNIERRIKDRDRYSKRTKLVGKDVPSPPPLPQ